MINATEKPGTDEEGLIQEPDPDQHTEEVKDQKPEIAELKEAPIKEMTGKDSEEEIEFPEMAIRLVMITKGIDDDTNY